MPQWMEETKRRIQALEKEEYFNSWLKQETELITFFVYPNFVVPENWIEKRVTIYKTNADKLGVEPPKIKFFIYPSMEVGKKIGVTPAITFIKQKEIHGHINQSPGHELTHILLGEINPSENLPANGLWAEGICVYFDGTDTDRKKHTLSLNFNKEVIDTPWVVWRENMPGNFYPLAGSIIQYCIEKYGWDAVLNYIKKLKDFGANDEALSLKIFHVTYAELQNAWKNWLKKNNKTMEPQKIKIKIELSKRVFCFYALLNMLGYDLKTRPLHPARKKVINFLKHALSEADISHLRQRIFWQELSKEFWFPYRIWVLCHGQPPRFQEINTSWRRFLDNQTAKEFEAALKFLWQTAGLFSFWQEINSEYLKVKNQCLKNAKIAVKLSLRYLSLSEKEAGIKQFIVIPNFLDEYNRGIGPKIDETAYALLGPSLNPDPFSVKRIQHEFLHSIINPLTQKIFEYKVTKQELSRVREYLVHAIVLRTHQDDPAYSKRKIALLKKQGFKNIERVSAFMERYEAKDGSFKEFLFENRNLIKKACSF